MMCECFVHFSTSHKKPKWAKKENNKFNFCYRYIWDFIYNDYY